MDLFTVMMVDIGVTREEEEEIGTNPACIVLCYLFK